MKSSREVIGKVLVGMAVSVAVSALMGILFAPCKGSKTRRRILHAGEDYAEGVKGKFSNFIDSVTDEYETVKEGAESWATKVKSKL